VAREGRARRGRQKLAEERCFVGEELRFFCRTEKLNHVAVGVVALPVDERRGERRRIRQVRGGTDVRVVESRASGSSLEKGRSWQ
jgi:hypothetical protein